MNTEEYLIKSHYHEEKISVQSISDTNIIQLNEDTYHAVIDGQSVESKIIAFDQSSKLITLSVNGNNYDISIHDSYDILIENMGFNTMNDQKLGDIVAPMPGLVVDVLVSQGDAISKGDAILILEAMKMENVLKASGDGVVKKVTITKGDTVDKGQILIEVE